MSPAIITLTTDFGTGSHYVAQIKAAILSRSRDAVIVDIDHSVGSQNIGHGAVVMRDCCLQFPVGSIHIGVVDPGVGSERPNVACRIGDHFFVAPDNGLLSYLLDRKSLDSFFQDASSTFHGRDVMAPVAACLASGQALSELGETYHEIHRLPSSRPIVRSGEILGAVEFVDSFGNLISNIPAEQLVDSEALSIECCSQQTDGISSFYSEGTEGQLIGLVSSSGKLELAVVGGSASDRLGAKIGDEFHVRW